MNLSKQTQEMKRVWDEDDCTTHDEDHETLQKGYKRLFGKDFVRQSSVFRQDCGDGVLYLMPGGEIVWVSYPGGSSIYFGKR